MAASISTKKEPLRRSHPGANSDRNAAVPTPKGTATSIAIIEVTAVANTKALAPKSRCVGSGSQVEMVKKDSPVVWMAKHALQMSMMTREMARAITKKEAISPKSWKAG